MRILLLADWNHFLDRFAGRQCRQSAKVDMVDAVFKEQACMHACQTRDHDKYSSAVPNTHASSKLGMTDSEIVLLPTHGDGGALLFSWSSSHCLHKTRCTTSGHHWSFFEVGRPQLKAFDQTTWIWSQILSTRLIASRLIASWGSTQQLQSGDFMHTFEAALVWWRKTERLQL